MARPIARTHPDDNLINRQDQEHQCHSKTPQKQTTFPITYNDDVYYESFSLTLVQVESLLISSELFRVLHQTLDQDWVMK